MKLEIDGATARTVWTRLGRYVVAAVSTAYALCGTLAVQVYAIARKSGRWVRSKGRGVSVYLAHLCRAEGTQRLLHRLSRGIVGVRREWSVLAVVGTPVLALVAEWWVVNSYGYRQIHTWVIGTWTGANPQLLVFAGVAALLTLSAAFTVFNSGFIPATALAIGPVFGIGFARYGLTVEQYGTVGIPEATAFAGFVAIVFGVPIGTAGFVLGTVLREGIARFESNRGPDDVSWNA